MMKEYRFRRHKMSDYHRFLNLLNEFEDCIAVRANPEFDKFNDPLSAREAVKDLRFELREFCKAIIENHDALQARVEELEAENARLKSEIVSKDKKVTDYENVYIVTMYRYGDREKHSYVYGAFSTEATAREWGEKEKDYRGGKYEPEIIRFCVDSPTDFLKVKNA